MITLMSGSGNTFCVIDNLNNQIKDLSSISIELCNKWHTDGVLFVEKSSIADIKMRIINADGSEAEMCGNGARCFARFVFDKKIITKNEMKIETKAGLINAIVNSDSVKVNLTEPFDLKMDLFLDISQYKGTVHFINTGVPHTVIIVDDVEKENVFETGRAIRYAPLFYPAGTNVNFVQITDHNAIKVRTYERGVENETGACGTGSVASAIIAFLKKKLSKPIFVTTKSKEVLVVDFNEKDRKIVNVSLEGKVVYLEGVK